MSSGAFRPPGAGLDEMELPTAGGGRLLQARRRIADGAVSVVTLDLFDTLVWRNVARPTDAFVLLATRMIDTGLLAPRTPPLAFRRLRVQAERRARSVKDDHGDGVEVTLDEIWAQFPRHLLTAERSAAAAAEVDLEVSIVRPDLDVVAFAEFAAARGCRLAVVSNTYLSAAHVARILARPGTEGLRSARLFCSSAYGVNKTNGLWKIVLDELDVAADRVLHVGDELASDLTVPTELGLHAVHLPRLQPETGRVLDREGVLPSERHPPRRFAVHARRGDYGLTSLRAKVGSRAEDLTLPADQVTAWHYGTTVLGPVLTGFADWVGREAERLEVRTIRCMMREGELLADLVNRGRAGRDPAIPAVPVWLSRAVMAKATISDADATQLRAMLNRRLMPTVAEYVANLGVGMGEVPELRHAATERMDRPELIDEVIEAITGSDHLRTRIIAESTASRERLVRYLEPRLDEDGDTTLLVDLGWGATIQWQLSRAFELAGRPHHLIGLYLATNSSAIPRALRGLDVRGYLADLGEPYDAMEEIGRSPEIIEQACLASCGSLIDFTPDSQPVLDTSLPPPIQMASKTAVQHGVRAFQREWLRYGAAFDDWPPFDGGERDYLLQILRRSVTHPTPAEARTFGAWTHDDNFGVDRREKVIAPRLGAYAPYLSPADLAEMSTQAAFWPLGLAAEYDASLAAAAQTILSGRLGVDDFAADRNPVTVSVQVDGGGGWDSGQSARLRINRNGLSYVHFDVRRAGIRSVRFDPCDGPAIWRVDWIELALRVTGRSDLQRARFEGPDALSALVYSGCRWLYDGVGIGIGDHCEIQIPLEPWATGSVYGVDFSAALAVLPLPKPDRPVALLPAEAGRSVGWAVARMRAEAQRGGVKAVGRGALRFARRRLA